MDKEGHLLKNRTATKRAEINFTVLVFILTSICFGTRSVDMVAGVLLRLRFLEKLELSAQMKHWTQLFHDVSNVFTFTAHAFDILVYILMDKNLRRCTLDLFGCKSAIKEAVR
jgi:hypothetical protein